MRVRPLLVGAIVLAALGAAAFLPPGGSGSRRGRGAGPGDVPTLRLEPQPFLHRVPAEGNLRATRATAITVPPGVEGPLRIAWLAPDGARVKGGDPVLRFDPTEMEKALRDAEDDLAKSRFKTAKEQSESAAAVKKLAADARVAELELDGAHRFQKKDETIFSRNERIESELDGGLASVRARHAHAAEQVKQRLSRADLDLLAIQGRQAGFRIGEAQKGLAALSLTAPHDGILVFRRDYRGNPPRVGDAVWQTQPLAEIPDLARMEAQVFVLEADAGGLGRGKPATVELESAPGLAYPARIARVDALAKPRLRGSPVQYFAVVLELARTDTLRMKPGARVRAVLTLDEVPRALAVPRQAVFTRGGRTVVYRRGAGGFKAVPVTLGPSGMGRVVIASGLQAGDTVALGDPEPRSSP
ncbi:MAG TPA: HlyD family efflux transporter periplasmic adaptor subunit [Thermoanaerobaculia bacterium]|nr:HlyD family efflux transporter periplasmic adaptor subunit [Thermoanaerobaculia bacterium]